jgi:hypothetical protein
MANEKRKISEPGFTGFKDFQDYKKIFLSADSFD